MPNTLFEQRVMGWRQDIFPIALREIERVVREGQEVLAGDAETLRLLELNFREKSRLLLLGTCYAAGFRGQDTSKLVATLVRWGALFTMIDTAIDEGGVHDRAQCERLAGFLVEEPPSLQSPLESFLARIRPHAEPQLAQVLRPYFERHARLVIFQHIDGGERQTYSREIGIKSYEDLCVDGSPGPLFALIRTAAELGVAFNAEEAAAAIAAIDALYFPEFGLLHVWADDLADLKSDGKTKDLNLAAIAVATGNDPVQAFSNLLKGFLTRISPLPSRHDVLFPLRLMIEEYQRQADAAAPGGTMARTLHEAAEMVRAAWGDDRL